MSKDCLPNKLPSTLHLLHGDILLSPFINFFLILFIGLENHTLCYQNNVEAWEILKKWEKPLLCAFSDQDHIFKGIENTFIKHIPGAEGINHVQIQGAGHFLQEDKPEECVEAILSLLD